MNINAKVKRGQLLKDLRKSKGLNQAELAKLIDVSVQAYQKYEYGTAEPTFDSVCTLADFYGVSTDYLLGREQPDQPPDRIQQVARDFGLSSAQTGILAAYLYMDEKDREQLVSYMRQLVEGGQEERDIYTAGELEDFRANDSDQDDAVG